MRLVLVIETGDDRAAGAPAVSFGEPAMPAVAPEAAPVENVEVEIAADPTKLEEAWERLTEAQRKLVDNMGADSADDHARKLWIGGALAIYATVSGETEEAVAARLGEEVQVPTLHGMKLRSPHETTQAPRHPGAQRHHEGYDDPDELPELLPDPGLAGYVTDPPPDEQPDAPVAD